MDCIQSFTRVCWRQLLRIVGETCASSLLITCFEVSRPSSVAVRREHPGRLPLRLLDHAPTRLLVRFPISSLGHAHGNFDSHTTVTITPRLSPFPLLPPARAIHARRELTRAGSF
eukprot:2572292-Pleurochrysis_carterae.AAC.1